MKIVIIEDEPQTASVLKDIIEEVQPGSQVVTILDSIEQSVRYFSSGNPAPDLIFMDIQLADGLSFEIFSRTRITTPVIFCTAYDQYTLQAFRSNGIEYILKPVREEEIRAAFAKVDTLKKALAWENDMMQNLRTLFTEKKYYKNTILVRVRESYIPVEVDSIGLFILENEVVWAWRFDNQRHPVFKTMDEIESSLDPAQFYRINRQTLINRKAIKEIEPYFNRKMVVRTSLNIKYQLIVSRLKVTPFMDWIEQP